MACRGFVNASLANDFELLEECLSCGLLGRHHRCLLHVSDIPSCLETTRALAAGQGPRRNQGGQRKVSGKLAELSTIGSPYHSIPALHCSPQFNTNVAPEKLLAVLGKSGHRTRSPLQPPRDIPDGLRR